MIWVLICRNDYRERMMHGCVRGVWRCVMGLKTTDEVMLGWWWWWWWALFATRLAGLAEAAFEARDDRATHLDDPLAGVDHRVGTLFDLFGRERETGMVINH